MAKYTVYETDEYIEWRDNLTLKSVRQIHERVYKIEEDGYFGHHKYLESEDLWEL